MTFKGFEQVFNQTPSYHDFEISICGYSGAGKTTLCEKLMRVFSEKYKVSYLKSDAHRFSIDHEGKDTFRNWQAGAESVSIYDPKHHAWVQKGEMDFLHRRSFFENSDFVLVEGRKQSPLPKLVMIGGKDNILEQVAAGEIDNVIGYIGEATQCSLDRPYFQRDQVQEIAEFIESFFAAKIATRPLKALLLTGGLSRRMDQDKALIEWNGESQMHRMLKLLTTVCQEVFVSARPGQRQGVPVIEDRMLDFGPLGGIVSAQFEDPRAAWLVIACDLPFLQKETLDFLLENRDPLKLATSFISDNDGLPEPLCAIYEPRSRSRLMGFASIGSCCPRKVLLNSSVKLIELINKNSLFNTNTPVDLELARSQDHV